MMKNREFRELQVSSTQLAIIFLGILVIGVVIFLLGVSVGKKHAQIAQKSNVIAEKQAEQVKEKVSPPETKALTEPATTAPSRATLDKTQPAIPKPTGEAKAAPKLEPGKETTKKAEPKPEAKIGGTVSAVRGNLYYVQVGALQDKPSALSTAQKFKTRGYPVVVLDPLPSDKRPVFRVRIGGFETKEEAESARNKLSSATGKKVDYFIVRD